MIALACIELLIVIVCVVFNRSLRSALRHLGVIRVPVFITIAAFVLYPVPQIQELFSVSVAAVDAGASHVPSPDSSAAWELLRIFASTAFLGACVWHSARALLRFDLVRGDDGQLHAPNRSFQVLAPRVLGVLIPCFVALGFLAANGASRMACAGAAVAGGLLVMFVTMVRRSLFGMPTVVAEGADITQGWQDAPPAWKWFAAIFVVVNVLALWPANTTWAADVVGPLPALMMLAGLFVMVTSPVVLLAARSRVMVFALLLVWACALQDFGLIDNHAVSFVDAAKVPIAPMAPLDKYLETWPGGCDAAYFVAAEGGGIRAAAWVAIALARLERERKDSQFGSCIVGASGVSGGSLGLAAFVAGRELLLSGRTVGGPDFCRSLPMEDALECRLVHMMTRDFMTPVLIAMFTTDQLQRVTPVGVLPDRGRALEAAFTRAFDEAFPLDGGGGAQRGPFGTDRTFADLYRHDGQPAHWTPALLLNATEVQSGNRVIQSGLRIDEKLIQTAFPAAKSLDSLLGPKQQGSISLIGAVHNSARFTFISPAGTLSNGNDAPIAQVVDGGYFENSGATTLLDLLHLFRSHAPAKQPVVVLQISNDGVGKPDDKDFGALPNTCRLSHSGNPEHDEPRSTLGELVPPAKALYETREARGRYARAALRRDVAEHLDVVPGRDGTYSLGEQWAWLRLREHTNGYPLPLGWRIGDCALCEMIAQFEMPTNRQALVDALVLKPTDPSPAFVGSEHCRFGATTAIMK